jgi:hypothetical protein
MLWYHDARMFTGHCPLTGVQIMSTTFMSSLQIRNKGKEDTVTFPWRSCVLYLYLSLSSQNFKKHWSDSCPVVEKRMHILVDFKLSPCCGCSIQSSGLLFKTQTPGNNPEDCISHAQLCHTRQKISENCSYTMFSKHQSSTQRQMKHPSELVLQKSRGFGGAGVIMVKWLVGTDDIRWTSDRPCPDSRKP